MSMFGSQTGQELARARALLAQGQVANALPLYESALEKEPESVPALLGIAHALLQTPDHHKARPHLEKAVALEPENAAALTMLSKSRSLEGESDKAMELLERAHAIDPSNNETRRSIADLHRVLGRYRESYDTLRNAVETGDANLYELISFARVAHRFEGLDRSIEITRDITSYDGIADHFVWAAGYLLASYLDKAGHYDEAFAAAKQANARHRKPFHVEHQITHFNRIRETWTRDVWNSIPNSGNTTDRPVYIVGMPRSGTTLVERIIGAHLKAFPGGERNEILTVAQALAAEQQKFMIEPPVFASFDWPSHAATVEESLVQASSNADRVVDKTPTNAIRLPIIGKLFPNAKIIRMRRDARDTCLSCYFHAFSGAHPYGDDLRDLGRFLPAYESLIDHYEKAFGLDILTVPYEELATDQEAWSRKIIDFLGLEWDDNCLRFHEAESAAMTSSNEQVREKMYTSSIGRWKNYEKHLAPLFEALGDHVPD